MYVDVESDGSVQTYFRNATELAIEKKLHYEYDSHETCTRIPGNMRSYQMLQLLPSLLSNLVLLSKFLSKISLPVTL